MSTIEPSKILVEDRQRREMEPLALEELKLSISNYGQLQPIGITKANRLVWGERRLRACIDLGIQVKTTLVDEKDVLTLAELELEENLRREDLPPVDLILTRDRMHALYLKEADAKGIKNWGLRESAERLKVKKSILQRDTKSALFILAAPEFFEGSCNTKGEIEAKVRQLEQKIKFKKLHENIDQIYIEDEIDRHTSGAPIGEGEGDFSPEEFKEKTIEEKIKEIENNPDIDENTKKILIQEWLQADRMSKAHEKRLQKGEEGKKTKKDFITHRLGLYNKWLRTGDGYDGLSSINDGRINIVLLDPLWGINYQEMQDDGMRTGDRYEDSMEKFFSSFEVLCKLAYQKMAEHSHLYTFFSITHFEFVYSTLEKVGFEVNRRPIIIGKEGIRATRQPRKWPGASYEPVAFARKGTRDLLVKGVPDFREFKWLSSLEKKGNPFAKPPTVYMDLIRRSAHPGDLVVDPMFGSGSAFVACEMLPELHLDWIGWDLKEENKQIALMNLTEFLLKGDLE